MLAEALSVLVLAAMQAPARPETAKPDVIPNAPAQTGFQGMGRTPRSSSGSTSCSARSRPTTRSRGTSGATCS